MPARPLIALHDVTVRRFERLVFPRTTWEIRAGRSWGVVGPNGSGKSTLLKALCKELPIVSGEVRYYSPDGGSFRTYPSPDTVPRRAIVHVSFESQRRLAAVASTYYQSRWNSIEAGGSATVDEALSARSIYAVSPFQVLGVTDVPADFGVHRRRAVEAFGLAPLLERRIIHLSNGESRKVLLARALAQDPKLLLLENPFDGLDRASRARLHETLNALMRDGLTVVLATARPDDLPDGVAQALVVEHERIVARGDTAVVVSRPPLSRSLTEGASVPVPSVSAPVPEVLVEMRDVGLVYGSQAVLEDITWTVRRGQNWAILGPNGSGKTSLLSLVAADNPQAYANDIRLFGRKRGTGESIWDVKRRIGCLSSELHLHHPRDVRCLDVVCSGLFDSIGLHRACANTQRATAERWLAALGLASAASQRFGALSEGLQRLTLLARALVKSPPLLLLDEPCQGLDPPHRQAIVETLDRVVRTSGTHVLYVTHRPNEVPSCVTHVLVLAAGRIAYAGGRDEWCGTVGSRR